MKHLIYIPIAAISIILASCSSSDTPVKKDNSKETTETQDSDSGNSTGPEDTDRMTIDDDPIVDTEDNSPITDEVDNTSDAGETSSQDDKMNGTSERLETGKTKTTATSTNPEDETETFNIHEYKKLNTFLGKYVTSSGHVNYSSIKSNKSELDAIITEFEASAPSNSWTKNQKLAFWINAYNIFTIKLVVDNYPTSSITKITAKPWDKKFVKIGSKTYSLGGIENDVIRKKYNEPRIHFALNCASKSCPNLLNKAFMPSTLSSQLTAQTKAFLKDTSKNKLDSKKSVQLSKIFEWYKVDFDAGGGVIAFINKYHGSEFKSPKISYLEYSWDLNK